MVNFFDKKTTLLQYWMNSIIKNNDSLLKFKYEFPSIDVAFRVSFNTVGNNLEDINRDFTAVKETVTETLDPSITYKLEIYLNIHKDKV